MRTRSNKTSEATIIRNAQDDRLVSITTDKGKTRASKTSVKVVAKTSDKHRDALKRLVNR